MTITQRSTEAARGQLRSPFSARIHSNLKALIGCAFALLAFFGYTPDLHAQYFQAVAGSEQKIIIKSNSTDSVIFTRQTPFEVPSINDTIGLVYHEPFPDSIMPRSAVVIGKIRLQSDDPEDLVDYLEKYARKYGADWVVGFSEPRPIKQKDGSYLYRSSATLLRVLDASFIPQTELAYSYYGANHLASFAAVNQWFDSYGRHFGSNEKDARVEEEEEQSDGQQ